MSTYCDTSALIALVAEEPSASALAGWLASRPGDRILSSLGWGEIVDTAARWVRRRDLALDQGRDWLTEAGAFLSRWTWVALVDADVVDAARYIERDPTQPLKLADAIHLAICRRLKATLLTGDRQQARAATALSIPNQLILVERT